MHVILYQPEIPPNTGNIIRLCANTGAHLHLIEPLGFSIEDAKLRRAGLDYHEFAALHVHEDLPTCLDAINASNAESARVFALSTRGSVRYDTHASQMAMHSCSARKRADCPRKSSRKFPKGNVCICRCVRIIAA